MKYCKKCLQPDTRPAVKFDEHGICYACVYEESKKNINWKEREHELFDIANWAKSKNKEYDCVIGVSGGKDSTFQALYAKEKLGLNPLLINYIPDQITNVGAFNMENLLKKGFDCIHIRPNPIVARKLVRNSFFEYGNLSKPNEFALWSSAYRMAIKFDIPLIVQGENAALTLGVAGGNLDSSGNAFNVKDNNTLGGADPSIWLSDEISENDLKLYMFPDEREFSGKEITAIWLQYYLKEWSQVGNADFSVARGLRGRSTESLYDLGRYRRYSSLDSDMHIVNQMIKYYKLGFGFATDEACYDIREGRISRDDAKWLVEEYDGLCGEQYIDLACRYMNISKKQFQSILDKMVNKDLFYKTANGWLPKFTVGVDM